MTHGLDTLTHWLYVTTIQGAQAKAILKALKGRDVAYFKYNAGSIKFERVIVNKDRTHSSVSDSYGEDDESCTLDLFIEELDSQSRSTKK